MSTFEATEPSPSRQPACGTVDEAFFKAATALTARLDLQGVCAAILEVVEQLWGATSSWIMLHDEQTDTLRTTMVRGAASRVYQNRSLPVGGSLLLSMAFREQKAVFVPDVQQERRWFDPASIHASGLRSVFMVPLVFEARGVGVVGLDSPRFSAESPPEHADRVCLEAIAAHAAIGITNARLYEASEQDRRRLRGLLEERRHLRGHVNQLREEVRVAGAFGDVVGESSLVTQMLRESDLVAPADTTVLVLGETGTGKELLARRIHQRSGRATGPFVAINCAALPEALVESELFGHERGAFTGALERKAGKFELAHRGTIFLDEIGDLPLEAQAKLLRVLQDRQVQRIGSSQVTPIDVRVIAATNQDLEAAIAEKRFRDDLYYRLSVFPIRTPALRERVEDIRPLATHFVQHFAQKLGRNVSEIAPAALEQMEHYHWPGNIRELQNVIERAIILSSGPSLEQDVLCLVRSAQPAAAPAQSGRVLSFAEAERQAITAALDATDWRVSGRTGAAHLLGLKPTTLHAKMRKLGIRRPSARTRAPE